MKIRDLFKKVEVYNEVSEIMLTTKAEISFHQSFFSSERFDNYEDFRRYIRREYVTKTADEILKSDKWEFNEDNEAEIEIEFEGEKSKYFVYLVSKW